MKVTYRNASGEIEVAYCSNVKINVKGGYVQVQDIQRDKPEYIIQAKDIVSIKFI